MDKGKNDPTKAPTVLGVCITFTVIAVVATILRLFTRATLIKHVGIEDWCIAFATFLAVMLLTCIVEQVENGMGQHFDDLAPGEYERSLKPFFYSIIIYYLALTFTKISILMQYHRLLIYPRTRLAVWIMGAVVTTYGIATVLDSIFLCTPVQYFWDQSIPDGRCLNEAAVWFSNAAFNIAIDIAIVVLPMPAIYSLELPQRQKIGLAALFALGGFVCVTSIVRLHSITVVSQSTDITWDNTGAATWSTIETNVGILCACLPTLRPLFSRIFPGIRASGRNGTNRGDTEITVSDGSRVRVPSNTLQRLDSRSPSQTSRIYENAKQAPDRHRPASSMYYPNGREESRESVDVGSDLEDMCGGGLTNEPVKSTSWRVQVAERDSSRSRQGQEESYDTP